jgi:hypothetical protein
LSVHSWRNAHCRPSSTHPTHLQLPSISAGRLYSHPHSASCGCDSMRQTSDCGIQRATPQLRGLANGFSLQRLRFLPWAVHVRSAVDTVILKQASFHFFRPPLPPSVIKPIIQVNSSFTKMINGTNKFRSSKRFKLPREKQEKILQRTLRMCQECAC